MGYYLSIRCCTRAFVLGMRSSMIRTFQVEECGGDEVGRLRVLRVVGREALAESCMMSNG